MSHLHLAIIVSTVAATCVPNASAWGKTGHRVTGQIAEAYLSPEARQAIQDILGSEDLAEASTWPDFMRASREGIWPREANPWHYVTVPEGEVYSYLSAPDEGDAITALGGFQAILQMQESTREEKALALRFAIHIIGDLHQPLHAGNGTDRGGNDFAVTFFGETTNLHSVWDSKMIDHEQLFYTELATWLSRSITSEEEEAWQDTDPLVWVSESTDIRDRIYPEERDLMWGYVFDHRDTYRTRLKQAGVRMAAYLNETFE